MICFYKAELKYNIIKYILELKTLVIEENNQ